MELIDSLKTWLVVVAGYIFTVMQYTSEVIQYLTVILLFVCAVARMINDVPKARESLRTYWLKRKNNG